ncbi:FadR family transcriptional regulator [Halobacillus salinarum]|uniref:FadR family transcriptional regulator n=2 Tax=Halobacillus salinarum TaxID=2932257 RepID=A0ABY4ESB5_9BACI|nr:FadR family transcriptional regulator [Halobacillus salinarum]
MLKSGQIKPGDKLESVEKLSERFDVGRSAIREALSALRAMGVLEMRQGEGTFVKTYDPSRFSLPISVAFLMKRENIKELLEVRKILEVGAVHSAALNRTEEDIVKMKAALKAMKAAKGSGELGEKADLDFHLAVAKAAQNHMLYNLMNSVSEIMIETMRETRKLWMMSEERTFTLYEEHRLIFEAVKGNEASEAQKLMHEHLRHVEEALAGYLDV